MRNIIIWCLVLSALIMQSGCCLRQSYKQKENAMAEETKVEEVAEKIPKINVRFIFSMCNDIDAMRHFYTDLLEMEEQAYYSTEEFGYLSYPCEGVYLMFFYSGQDAPVLEEWAWQPGYEGGNLHVTSWAIEIPEADFPATLKRLKDAGVKTFSEDPEWRQDSYWGFSAVDPQGNTIEVYTSPKEKPASQEWSED